MSLVEASNLTDFIIGTLQDAWPKSVAPLVDPSGEQFVVGVFRDISVGGLHWDWAPGEAPTWPNGNLSAQLSANIYLTSPRQGGELVVYDRHWVPGDEELFRHRLPDGQRRGYERSVVEGVRKVVIEPGVRNMCLFQTRETITRFSPSPMGDG